MQIESYRIDLNINSEDYRFTGNEQVKLKSDGGDIVLDSVNLNVERVESDGAPTTFDVEEDLLRVHGVDRGNHTLTVKFDGTIGQNLTGLYLAKTVESEMFTTQFESTGARRVFPCVDNPSYKAEFTLSLDVLKDLDTISNMPVQSVSENGERKTVVFQKTPKMSTYLLYMGIGKFDQKSVRYGDKEIILAAPAGHLSPSDFPLEVAKKCLSIFEDYFGIPYMLPKMHLISVPEFAAGAMENWGALTFREILLYADSRTGSLTKKKIASVIAHEIAHQWFGDLVTMEWWNDLWLNESFATFMAYRMVNELYPEMDSFGEMINTRTSGALTDDSLVSSHPIDVKVEDPNSVAQIFDQISYGKGASVLRMIETFAGREKFREGIREYLKAHQYSNTKGENLWQAIERASGLPVSRIMEVWIKKQGYPVVSATEDGGKIKITQSRFLLNSNDTGSIWPVPLTVKRESGVESVVLDGRETSIEAAGFLKLNDNNSGFYRAAYSGTLLSGLMKNVDKLSYLDRWGIVNDHYAFLISGRLTLDEYLSLITSFENEKHHLVMDEVASQLFRIHMKAPDNVKIRDSAVKVIRGYLDRIGEKKEDEDMNMAIVRGSLSRMLAILDSGFANEFSARFDDIDSVDPDLTGAVILSYAISRNDFRGLVERLKSSRNDEERVRIISALGWLRNGSDLEKANRMVLDGEIKRQDCMSFFSSLAAAPHSRQFSFDHLKETVEFLKRTFVGSRRASAALEGIIPLVGVGRNSEMKEVLDEIRSPETEKGILKGTELLEINEKFRSLYEHS